jgi:hypothetical protein
MRQRLGAATIVVVIGRVEDRLSHSPFISGHCAERQTAAGKGRQERILQRRIVIALQYKPLTLEAGAAAQKG